MWVRGAMGHYQVAGEPFAAGGSARLFRCPGSGYVYKQYRLPVSDPAEITRLRRLARLGRLVLLDDAQPAGATPESSVNWPLDIVEGQGGISGVIIPEIPARFFTVTGGPRGLDFLILARADPPPARTRLAVLIRLAEIFAWLDAERLVHGDLSQRNVVWCARPEPSAYLIDADGLHPQQPPPRVGLATPGWTDPRLAAGLICAHDHHSDAYALALAMYRGLFLNPGYLDRTPGGEWPKPTALPGDLDPRIRRLLDDTLGSPLDGGRRATAAEWVETLLSVYLAPGGFDPDQLRVLDRHAQQHRDHHHCQRRAPVHPSRPAPARPPRHSPGRPPAPPAPKTPVVGFLLQLVLVALIFGLALFRYEGEDRPSPSRGGFSGDGSTALEAELSFPHGLALDRAGNLYIADTGNDRVRRVDPGGVITTVAGGGTAGLGDDGGPGTAAELLAITGLAVDQAGNLYIAEVSRVRRVDPAGTITTVVQGDAPEPTPGRPPPAVIPRLSPLIDGIGVDAAGNLYLLDINRQGIFRVDPAGIVTVLAGSHDPWFGERSTGVGTLTVDADGTVYVAATSPLTVSGGVRTVDPAGTVTDLAGALYFRTATVSGLSLDGAGNLYIAEFMPFVGQSVVSRLDRAGVATRLVSSVSVFASGHSADLAGVGGIAVAPDGTIYISDTTRHRVVRFDPATGTMVTVAGKRG